MPQKIVNQGIDKFLVQNWLLELGTAPAAAESFPLVTLTDLKASQSPIANRQII